MPTRRLALLLLGAVVLAQPALTLAEDLPPVSDKARRIHESGFVFDGHNDLPWELRTKGDATFTKTDLRKSTKPFHTDIPRLREGGVKAQFWSVYIPTAHPNPSQTVLEQIDIVHRMIEKYPDVFALALDADDVERAVKAGKIASLLGIEGGIAIENNLALLRTFARLGVRYMTLTHNGTIDWADAATDEAKHDGLTPFGERVVREMNRLGILVDISHVSPATMADALRITKAPVIASHSSAFAVCPHPRNVPDEILKALPANGGVVMVNFFPPFVDGDTTRKLNEARERLQKEYPDPAAFSRALAAWTKANPAPRATIAQVADHIDHIVKVAGIDHVGLGGDFDGINRTPVGLEDVSTYPRLTDELLRRGHSEADIHKILSGNALRALRRAGEVARELQASVPPEVDQPKEIDDAH
jgi:membrane dipeptidase